jgi:hypothetical protein
MMAEEYVFGYETAVIPVLDWVKSSQWLNTFRAHGQDFFAELTDAYDESLDTILSWLPTPLWGRATRCCFDDFLTLEYESNPSNPLDQYLDEVGMGPEEAVVDFLIAFRDSVVRVYHVVERTPYESVVLRDLIGGAGPVLIEDEMLTAPLSAGDNIATRIVTVKEKDYLAGSILVLSDEMLETFKDAFEATMKEQMRGVEKYLQKDLRHRRIVRNRILKEAATALTVLWVTNALATLQDAPPFGNDDEPESVFEARIAYSQELEPVIEWLDEHPDLGRPLPKEFLWLWFTDRANPEASLKAMVWIAGQEIYLESSERGRIEEAVRVLVDMLGDYVDEVEIKEVGSDLSEDDEDPRSFVPTPMAGEDESTYRSRVHASLDQRLRSILDHPVTKLNGKVPRELAKTVKGRKQLCKWLESLEFGLRADLNKIGLANYDFVWIWKELGMETYRQSSLFELDSEPA